MKEQNPLAPLTQEEMRAWWPFTRVEGALLERLNRQIPPPKPTYEEALF